MGEPVSTASMPRTMPSVELMAMQRTTSSPSCWATSQTSLAAVALDLDGVEQVGQVTGREADVQHRADDLHDGTNVLFLHSVDSFPLQRLGAGNDFCDLPA